MRKISPSAVAVLSGAGAVLLATTALYPIAASAWGVRQERLAQARDITIASELEQRDITRALLLEETGRPPLCDPLGGCPEEPVYFDRTSATLLFHDDVDTGADRRNYEYRRLRSSGHTFDRDDNAVPIALVQRLDELSRIRFEMADPGVPDVDYVMDSEHFDAIGSEASCTPERTPRLIRVSRAAVHQSGDSALILIQRIYCDGSGSPREARLKRDAEGWHVESSW